ncbi:hypothetical protein ACRXCV_04570 [Halobacteriovorax sp. GFR7]|uniref:hypothetical protein n=1 Tax=unclassified Halobacteriovorax TaxID=2639665 RepID=UPI003D9549F6
MYQYVLIIALILSTQVNGKCIPTRDTSKEIDELQIKLSKDKNKPNISSQKSLLLNLLKVSTPKIRYQYNIRSNSKNDDYIISLSTDDLRRIIKKAISKQSNWESVLNKPINKGFLTGRNDYLSAIGDNSYLLAWYYINIHKVDQALTHLIKLFNDEYKKALKTTSTHNALCGSTPQFYWLKNYYKLILLFESPENSKNIKKKYREFEIHVSTLPRFYRMT